MVWLLFVTVVFPVVFVGTVWSSLHRVPDTEVRLLVVSGEERAILHGDLYFVPPFVSSTYPVDPRTMRYETPQGSKSIPPDLREDVERAGTDLATAE